MSALSRIRGHTVGVFAADRIPRIWSKPAAFVFNTERHNKSGSHWVAIYVSKEGRGWYFDSFGRPPMIPEYRDRIARNCHAFTWNKQSLQSDFSNVCGQYCIMFLHYMSTGMGIKRFLENFSHNARSNDEIARRYGSRIQARSAKRERRVTLKSQKHPSQL